MEQIYDINNRFIAYKNTLNKYKSMVDIICLVNLVVYFAHLFLTTTTFPYDTELVPFSKICVAIAILITIYRCTCIDRNDITDACIIGILLVIGISNLLIRHDRSFLAYVLMIISVRGMSFRRIVSCLIITGSFIMLAAVIASQLGLIENLVYNSRNGRHAYALGIMYTTDFAAHVFFLFLGFMYIKRGKLKALEYAVIAVLALVIFEITRARNNTICILLFLTATFAYNLVIDHASSNTVNCIIKAVCVMSVLFIITCIVTVIAITVLYTPDNATFAALDIPLGGRFYMGNQAFRNYGLAMFGNNIPQKGLGGASGFQDWYFFLDISYVNVLLCKGIVVFAAMLLIYFRCVSRCIPIMKCNGLTAQVYAHKNVYLLTIFAVIALQCTIEHHWAELVYNYFVLATFADLS